MMPKYPNDEKAVITEQHYKNVMESKGLSHLQIRRTKTFENLQNQEFAILTEHVWTKTDKLIHLSRKYYGTNDFWWTIGLINGKPTDAHYTIGDVVNIPMNPSRIVEATR